MDTLDALVALSIADEGKGLLLTAIQLLVNGNGDPHTSSFLAVHKFATAYEALQEHKFSAEQRARLDLIATAVGKAFELPVDQLKAWLADSESLHNRHTDYRIDLGTPKGNVNTADLVHLSVIKAIRKHLNWGLKETHDAFVNRAVDWIYCPDLATAKALYRDLEPYIEVKLFDHQHYVDMYWNKKTDHYIVIRHYYNVKRQIDVIKAIRKYTRAGLKDAKELTDNIGQEDVVVFLETADDAVNLQNELASFCVVVRRNLSTIVDSASAVDLACQVQTKKEE